MRISVLNTRPRESALGFSAKLREQGYDVIEQPLLAIAGPPDDAQAHAAMKAAASADAWIFVSVNAVAGARALCAQAHPGPQLLAVGAATASALAAWAQRPVVCAQESSNSEGLLALAALKTARSVAIFAAPDGRDLLRRTLTERGVEVSVVHSYTRTVAPWRAASSSALAQASALILLATSVAALGALATAFKRERLLGLKSRALLVASPRIGAAARTLGFSNVHIAGGASDDQLLAALVLLTSAHDDRAG